jgi:predicted N-acyltransferase
MAQRIRLYETIDRVPLADWNEASQGGSHGFMDPGFLRAVEKGFAGEARIFHVLIDQDGKPAASASLCLFPIDLLVLATPALRNKVGWVQKLFPGLGKVNILMCGLPFSAGQSHLAFAPGADRARAVQLLDTLMRQLARQHGARLVVLKEFSADDCEHMDLLKQHGYCRADSPPSYAMPKSFPSLTAYCDVLKSHYRRDIRKSLQKFERADCRVVHLEDPDEIRRVYIPEVHPLYEAVVGKADLKLEVLPHRFFHELAGQLPGQVTLTVAYRGERVVAFGWGLSAGPEFHGLFCGIDYEHNAECDLYFNVLYHSLDHAFRRGSQRITLGQTADTFKTRLGCNGTPRYIYARGTGPALSWVLRRSVGFLFPPRPPLPAKDVFKAEEEKAPAENRIENRGSRNKQRQMAYLAR